MKPFNEQHHLDLGKVATGGQIKRACLIFNLIKEECNLNALIYTTILRS